VKIDNLASTEGLDAALVIDNSDADDAMAAGLLFVDAGGGITNLISSTNFSVTGAGVVVLASTDTIASAATGTTTFHRAATGSVTLTCTDDDANCAVLLAPGGTGTATVGSGTAASINLTTDGSGSAEIIMSAGSVDHTEQLDTADGEDLHIVTWFNCTDSDALDWAGAADTDPDLALVSGSPVVEFDVTGGSVDTDTICTTFVVPARYASGGSISFRVTQGGATAGNLATLSCTASIDGAAAGGAGTANVADGTAAQTVTLTPAGAFAAGASVGLVCTQTNAAADDVVNLHSAFFSFTSAD
jgi:hypothetical protein